MKGLNLLDQFNLTLLLRQLVKEQQATRAVLQAGVDSYRLANMMNPLYEGLPLAVDAPPARPSDTGHIKPGDFLTISFIQELAEEFMVPTTLDTDLEALAIERGWMDPDGKFLQLPRSAAGMRIEDLDALVSASVKVGR